jgi:hypothetical protein
VLGSAFAGSDASPNASRKEITVQSLTIPRTLLSRRASLALVASALLPQPTGVRADHDGTCHHEFVGGGHFKIDIQGPGPGLDFGLQVGVGADEITVRGAIRLRDETGTTLLLAVPDSAEANCADANGNGSAGITALQLLARNPRTGDRVRFVLVAREGEDLDQSGFGFVTLSDGESEETVEVEVRLIPTSRGQRRRRGRRR